MLLISSSVLALSRLFYLETLTENRFNNAKNNAMLSCYRAICTKYTNPTAIPATPPVAQSDDRTPFSSSLGWAASLAAALGVEVEVVAETSVFSIVLLVDCLDACSEVFRLFC